MDTRKAEIKNHCYIPLIVSYVASMFIYPLNGVMPNSFIVYLVMIIAFVAFVYSFFNMFKRVTGKHKTRLLAITALFLLILHILVLLITALFGGLIALVVGAIFVYQFSQQIIVGQKDDEGEE